MSTGLHARRATGLPGAEREESFTQTESVAKGSPEGRAAYEADRRSPVFFFTDTRCSNQAGDNYIRGSDDFFSFGNFRFYFLHRFYRAVPCCAFSFVRIKRIK